MFKLKRKNVILGVILICILIASYFLYNYFKIDIKEEQRGQTQEDDEDDEDDEDTMVQEKTPEKTLNHSSILPFQSVSSVGPYMVGESISLLGPDDTETFDTIKPYPF
jgi:hypothetical protein